MKKLFGLLAVILLASCSSDDMEVIEAEIPHDTVVKYYLFQMKDIGSNVWVQRIEWKILNKTSKHITKKDTIVQQTLLSDYPTYSDRENRIGEFIDIESSKGIIY